ncbi:DinB family protein [Virgibacillus tibetensis]
MEETIFRHMKKVRGITEQQLSQIPEELADKVPVGFNNNMRWNFGHIALIQEKLVYGVRNEKMEVPEAFFNFFGPRTKPANWKGTPPSLTEIATVLSNQKKRIELSHSGLLEEELAVPFTNGMGLTFYTTGETLLFSFYHEGRHLETIKRIDRALKA